MTNGTELRGPRDASWMIRDGLSCKGQGMGCRGKGQGIGIR